MNAISIEALLGGELVSAELHRAARRGNLDAIRRLLRAGAPVDAPDGHPDPQKVSGWLEAIEHAGDTFMPKTGVGKTALMFAVENAKADVVQELLSFGASVASRDALGRTPLAFAVDANNTDLCGRLLNLGADPNAVDRSQVPIITRAVIRKSMPLLELLMARGAVLDPACPPSQRPLTQALRVSSPNIAFWLLDQGAPIDDCSIREAFVAPRPEIVAQLLDRGMDPNLHLPDGWTPIAAAMGLRTKSREAVVNLLLERGAAPSRCRYSILYTLLEPSDIGLLQTLARAGASLDAPINENAETYLMRLAAYDQTGAMTQAAIQLGADPSLRDISGRNALDFAQERQNAATLQILEAAARAINEGR